MTTSELRILGIDPGGTTGLCSYMQGSGWFATQLPAAQAATFIEDWFGWPPTVEMHVVAERFVPSARALSFQPDALEIIGHTRYLCARKGISFSLQTPAAAKGLAPNDLLKTIGAYQQKTPHGMDAARHVVLHLHKHHPEILRAMRQQGEDHTHD